MKIELKKIQSSQSSYQAEEMGYSDYHFFDIYADGQKVGRIELLDHLCDDEEENEVCYVERIDVYEEFRGNGIGTKVLTQNLWEECGYRYAVVAPDNENARRLYERIGEEYSYICSCQEQDFGYNDQGYGVYVI